MNDDAALLAEIEALSERAKDATPRLMDTLAMATDLARRFEHRTVEEIREQIGQKFRAKGLFWADR